MTRNAFLLPGLMLALPAGLGFGQSIDIVADRFEMLLEERRTTYTGNVVAVQGERRFVGDQLVIVFGEDSRILSMRAVGSPAKLTDGEERPPLSLTAATLSYELEKSLVRADGGGILTRGGDSVAADVILYDLRRERAQALAANASRARLRLAPRAGTP